MTFSMSPPFLVMYKKCNKPRIESQTNQLIEKTLTYNVTPEDHGHLIDYSISMKTIYFLRDRSMKTIWCGLKPMIEIASTREHGASRLFTLVRRRPTKNEMVQGSSP